MNYYERKNYRIKKKADKYLKKAYLFNCGVVIGALNIFGSYASIFISLPYFIFSTLISAAVIAICYKAAVYCEEQAEKLLKSTRKSANKRRAEHGNIIRVDFSRSYINSSEAFNDESASV